MPNSLEELDLLLVMVATSRMVRRDGVHFQGLRYMDPTLAAYVGEPVTVRYDPRDLAEIRVFHHNRFLGSSTANRGLRTIVQSGA
jgi:putative transposase